MTRNNSVDNSSNQLRSDSRSFENRTVIRRKRQKPGHQRARLEQNFNHNMELGVHGDKVKKKEKDIVRILFQNVDSIYPASETNCSKVTKVARLRRLLNDYEVDLVAMTEVGVQWDLVKGERNFNNLLSNTNDTRTIMGWNIHEQFGKLQQGGTGMTVSNMLIENIIETGTDPSGLGRWCWIKFRGENNISSRIITAYQPVYSRNIAGVNCFAQHRRYFRKQGSEDCPRVKFKEDLFKELRGWIDSGERILMLGDFNEDCTDSNLSRRLKGEEFGMVDVIERLTNKPGPPTWINGRKQIDAAFATKDFEVVRGCYLPHFIGVGDHRAIVLDIPFKTTLGIKKTPICKPSARRLINIPSARRRYISRLEAYFKNHKLLKRSKECSKKASYPVSEEIATELNKIDRLRKDGMLYAERKCRKLHMGNIEFSEEVNKRGKIMCLWKLVIRLKEGRIISRSKIKRMAKSCDITRPLSISVEDAKLNYHKAKKEYLKCKPYAQELREIFLEGKANMYESQGKVKEMESIKRIIREEQQRLSWRIINKYTKENKAAGVSKIEVLREGKWAQVDTKTSIEEAIMEELMKRFRLTDNSPMMSGPLRVLIGLLADTEASRKILEGTFQIPEEVDQYTRLFLSKLKRINGGTIKTIITAEDLISYWKKAKEKKASSFSGLHFGHYKAAVVSRYLCLIHAILTSTAGKSGFAFDRWKKGSTVMLEKIAGVIKVNKLRAILLMEADFNQHNKEIFGRRMITKAERDGLIPKDQYGSRENHRAIEVAFNRMMYFDTVRLRRTRAALASVDAAQCYDRMTHAAISLGCQYVGIPIENITSMLLAIQGMEFFLRTAFGDSNNSFGGSREKPFQGSCQGNGASPGVWLIISSIIIKCLYERGMVFKTNTALSLNTISFAALAFVDDTDLLQIAMNHKESAYQVTKRLQDSVDTWNGCLKATGGALRPEKCSWYSINFRWRSDGSWVYQNKMNNVALKVQNEGGRDQTIEQLEANQVKEAVGVLQRPDGGMEEEYLRCKSLCDNWAVKVKNGHLSRRLAMTGLKSQLWPRIKYRLPTTTFTETQCENITKQLYWQILPNLGTCRNFPKVFRYASYEFCGLNLPHPYIEQGIESLEMLLTYGNSDCLSNKMLMLSIEQFQLEVGSKEIFFNLDHKKWGPPLTRCWLWHVWKFASTNRVKILSKISSKVQRINDEFFMDLVHNHYTKTSEIRSINRCRIMLEVLTVADITTGDGTHVRDHIYQVKHNEDEKSKYMWAKERPSAADKRIWREAINKILANGKIIPRLGDWISNSHKNTKWWYSERDKCIYKQIDKGYLRYESTVNHNHRRGWAFYLKGWSEISGGNLLKTTVRIINEKTVIYEGSAKNITVQHQSEVTVEDWLQKFEESKMFGNMVIPNNNSNLAEEIKSGTLVGVADGSYQSKQSKELASAAWIIEGITSSEQCKGVCLSPQGKASSYRAELTGLYAMLCTILATCKVHNITAGCVYLGCDNDIGVMNASKKTCKVMQKMKEADLIRAIRQVKKSIPITVKFIKVTGHMDEEEDFDKLDRLSQLNILCDNMAKHFLSEAINNGLKATGVIPHEMWGIQIMGKKINQSIGPSIRYAISFREMLAYHKNKKEMGEEIFKKIDWEAIGVTMRNSSDAFRIWISKHMSGFCATARRMHKIGIWNDSICPCCKKEEEDTYHLLKCSDKRMCEIADKNLEDLKNWMSTYDTKPELYLAIVKFVKEKGKNKFSLENIDEDFSSTIQREVNRIGWTSFMEGKIPIKMGVLQEQHFHEIGSSKTRLNWTSGLIKRLTQGILNLWLERNNILHAREKNGLKVKEASELWCRIQHQLDTGSGGLGEAEKKEWDRATNRIKKWSAIEQKAWADTMELSREFMSRKKMRTLSRNRKRKLGEISREQGET